MWFLGGSVGSFWERGGFRRLLLGKTLIGFVGKGLSVSDLGDRNNRDVVKLCGWPFLLPNIEKTRPPAPFWEEGVSLGRPYLVGGGCRAFFCWLWVWFFDYVVVVTL